jgi:hypothetical protein
VRIGGEVLVRRDEAGIERGDVQPETAVPEGEFELSGVIGVDGAVWRSR